MVRIAVTVAGDEYLDVVGMHPHDQRCGNAGKFCQQVEHDLPIAQDGRGNLQFRALRLRAFREVPGFCRFRADHRCFGDRARRHFSAPSSSALG